MTAANRTYGLDLGDRARSTAIAAAYARELVWVADPATGGTFALLQVDKLSGLWIVRSRFPPSTVVQRHLHSGSVFAITLEGRWSYPELGTTCVAGDFIVEEAGVVHSLTVVDDDDADILFLINGSIVYFDAFENVERIEDWRTVLDEYRTGCAQMGSNPHIIGA